MPPSVISLLRRCELTNCTGFGERVELPWFNLCSESFFCDVGSIYGRLESYGLERICRSQLPGVAMNISSPFEAVVDCQLDSFGVVPRFEPPSTDWGFLKSNCERSA